MAKKKEKKRKLYKPVQSTQQNIPIRDFIDGIVVTKDGSYVKILEVLPVPFFLKRISDQNKIGDLFFSMLKSAPDRLHFKSVSAPANLSEQIELAEKHIKEETNLACRKMGKEYRDTLIQGQNYGITRRFFVSFPFEGKTKGFNKYELSEIVRCLNVDANRLIAGLNSCGNEVIEPDPESPNEENAKLFYMLYH